MKRFLKEELLRLVDKIPQTDPTTSSYHMLLHSIEALDAIGSTIEAILAMSDEDEAGEGGTVTPFPAPVEPIGPLEPVPQPAPVTPIPEPIPVPAPVEPPVETEKAKITAPDVRKALLDAKKRGVDVKAVLQKFYANNFQNLPEEKYADFMAALEVM